MYHKNRGKDTAFYRTYDKTLNIFKFSIVHYNGKNYIFAPAKQKPYHH